MIDRAVLDALAGAVDRGGDVDLALAGLRRVDPLLRGAARRRLRTAHADAVMATAVKQGPEAGCHALRLSYLMVARALPPRAVRDDPAALERVFEDERRARPRRGPPFWWPTALGALTLVAAASAGATAVARSPRPEPAAASTPADATAASASPPPSGAFAEGGVPAPAPGDAAVARALGTDLLAYLVALDRRSEARGDGVRPPPGEAEAGMKAARERALSPEVREALGPGAARALEALFTAAAGAAEAAAPRGPRGSTLGEAAAALDDELAARGLGYFVDADVVAEAEGARRLVLVYAFRVARVSLFAAGGRTFQALHLRRLDRMNWSHTLLGFTRPTLRAAAVLLDQVDEQVVTLIAPCLADGAQGALYDPEAAGEERARVEARAGEVMRDELGALPGLDRAAAAKLGKLLGRRRALFARWEKLAAARGMALALPKKLRLPEGFRASLEPLAPRDELDELALVDAALDDRTRQDAFMMLRDALATSIERHEVQHRLDAAGRAAPPPMPARLEALVGPLSDGGADRHLAVSARAELSAYLAELARDPRTPRTGLTLIARFLFDRRMHGTPESYAALVILEGLGEAAGAAARAPLLGGGAVDRRAVAALWLELVALPPERLRDAAARLWASLFSTPLPELRKIAPPG